ncbi:hypothetical protein HK102_002521, partial [Quaeritorhiza haematococci]
MPRRTSQRSFTLALLFSAALLSSCALLTICTPATASALPPTNQPKRENIGTRPHSLPTAVVVGAGPVGLYTAGKLARKGFDVTILERETGFGDRLDVVVLEYEAAKEIVNKHIPRPSCINFLPSIAQHIQCLDTTSRDRIIAESDGMLNARMFTESFKLHDIQRAFIMEFEEIARERERQKQEQQRGNAGPSSSRTFGNVELKIGDFRTQEEAAGLVDEADLIVCADGVESACRDRFIESKPVRFALDDTTSTYPISPDGYGASVVLEASDVPPQHITSMMNTTHAETLWNPQYRYRGLVGSDGLLYMDLVIRGGEYRDIKNYIRDMDPSSDEYRAHIFQKLRTRMRNGMGMWHMLNVVDGAIAERGMLKIFPIWLQLQQRAGFASLRRERKSGDQVVIVVGDAAISSHPLSGVGLSLGLEVADSALSFLDADVLRLASSQSTSSGIVGVVKGLFSPHDRRKGTLENLIMNINGAAHRIA